MSCQKYQKKQTCSKSFAVCVQYEGTLSEYTSLEENACYDVEEVIEDITIIVDSIKNELDFETLRGSCIEYLSGEIKIIDVLSKFQDLICSQAQTITTMQSDIATLKLQVQELQSNICP